MPELSAVDGVHVVTVEDDHSYHLDEEALRSVLLSKEVADMPVAIISVAGAYRGGKSFLLNFFLRYLSATESARADGSWLGDKNAELIGFSWRGGSVRNTTGILLWPEPFIIKKTDGEKVAVLLMDTQGTFDSTSSVRDCSTIFALSTLLSSTQIYNLRDNIREDDLQNLQLFTDYGKLMKNESEKAFQVLEFLVRDWISPWEYAYGYEGGQLYLDKKLKIEENQPNELKELRKHIKSSFSQVACFLMPHPGLGVANPRFKGRISEIDTTFINALKDLVLSIFSPVNLSKKLIAGQSVKGRELFDYFKTYMTIFNSNEIPTPKTILEVTIEAGLLMAVKEAREQFESNMEKACGTGTDLSMPDLEVVAIHAQQVAAARATFRHRKLFGEQQNIDKKLEDLERDLNSLQKNYLEINKSKTLKAQNEGNAAYEAAMFNLTQGKLLCVHAVDLRAVHNEALAAALAAFDKNRKKLADGKTDPDREKLKNEFASKYSVLRLTNEQNNKANASEVKTEYFTSMVLLCNKEPKLTEAEFQTEHEKAMQRALEEFESRRNRPNSYIDDTYKFNLEQGILLQFSQLKQINQSSNTKAFQLAMIVFNESNLKVSELRKHCLHPSKLKELHDTAVCQALVTFRPNRSCEVGFTDNDKDEWILNNLFKHTYENLVDINNVANEAAVEAAYAVYVKEYDAQCGFFYFLTSWDTARTYHAKALDIAQETFYSKRRDRLYHGEDSYMSTLEEKCRIYYNPDNK